jgi:hypothetical protein
MAMYMFFYAVPDRHLEFLRDNPASFDSYLRGEVPDLTPGFIPRLLGKRTPEIPHNWPNRELEAHSPEINHRQVHVFHYVLNGKSDLVEDVGSLFQTWFKPRHDSPAIVIDGENFAFDSANTPRLLELIKGLTPESIRERLQASGRASDVYNDIELLEQSFAIVEKACSDAVSKGQGLLWTNR